MTRPADPTADRARHHAALRAEALADVGGSRSFRLWKLAAFDEVFQMVQRAPRMDLLQADLQTNFELFFRVAMPVPRWPRDGKLQMGDAVVFHLVYLDAWRHEPAPGWAPLGVATPPDIFHPNSRPSLRGALCLGQLPAGIPPKELILLGYYLVSLQDYTLNEYDPHGVLNPAACEYYRCHPEYLPLTRAGLYEDWSPEGETP